MENKIIVLCDTNILIEVYRNNLTIIENLQRIGQSNLAVSDVTSAELFYGARNKTELRAIRKDLNNLTVLSVNQAISSMAVELIEQYSLSHKLNLPDALIASTAIWHDIPLYTLNLKDFRFLKDINLYQNPKFFE